MGGALIVAIGAQNVFVLRQGLRREYGWLVAGICALADLLLVSAGVAGLGPILIAGHVGLLVARWAGVAWLLWQAWLALKRVWLPQVMALDGEVVVGMGRVVIATLGVTLLNPHVYLDTVVMLGVIGSQQPEPAGFVVGASLASLLWFFGLVCVGHWLSPRLKEPRWWQAIDAGVAAIMVLVAVQLAVGPP